MKRDSLYCFELKRGKAEWKERILSFIYNAYFKKDRITLKNSESFFRSSLFHSYEKSDGERFAPIAKSLTLLFL